MSDQTLLNRCKQTIQSLNSVIITQKQQIDLQSLHNRKLALELQQKQQSRLALLQQASKLKRYIIQQRNRFANQNNNLQNLVLNLKQELDHRDQIYKRDQQTIKQLETQNESLIEQIKLNEKLIKQWQQIMEDVKNKVNQFQKQKKQMEQNRKVQNEKYQKSIKQYEQKIYELKLKLKQSYDQLDTQIKKFKNILNENQSLNIKVKEQQQILLVMQQQNNKHFQLIQTLKYKISKYDQQIYRYQSQLASYKKQILLPSRKTSLKNSIDRYRHNSQLEFIKIQPESSQTHYNKQNGISDTKRQIPTSQVKKKLNFQDSKKILKEQAAQRLIELQNRVKGLMKQIKP